MNDVDTTRINRSRYMREDNLSQTDHVARPICHRGFMKRVIIINVFVSLKMSFLLDIALAA